MAGVVNLRKLAAVCFKYDPELARARRVPGEDCGPIASSAGAVRVHRGEWCRPGRQRRRQVRPCLPKPKVAGVDAKGGYGNVPFHRTEFTAQVHHRVFQPRPRPDSGYGLGEDAKLLVALSLWKVRRFLDSNMRLRSACELEMWTGKCRSGQTAAKGFTLDSAADLAKEVAELIEKCKPLFAEPAVTELTWNKP